VTDIKRILCPVDFSEFSRHAFDHAIAVAHAHQSEITLLNVFPIAIPADQFAYEPVKLTEDERTRRLRCLASLADTEGTNTIPVQCAVREGADIHAEVLKAAEEIDADLIILGTHGRSGFQHLVLGSVTEKILRKAACPVLTVPSRVPDAVPAGPGLYGRILCGIDFSDNSLAALDYARSLASGSRTHIDAVSVLQDVPLIEDTPSIGIYHPELTDELRTEVGTRLEQLVLEGRAGGYDIEGVTTVGSAYEEILRLAKGRQADLIVLGVHGRAPADRLLFGSTTNHVVREAACPVLTVRPKETRHG
jgi:nucleotide-binding universal stress UspA family protein